MTRRMVKIARSLRKRMTPHEIRLWVWLKTWRREGFVFRRQAPIGPYIVDFACFTPKLVIEVDGGQHNLPEHQARDEVRDAWLEGEGFRVVRVWNMDVFGNLDGVLTCIREALDEASQNRKPRPPSP
ncbi:endonuclease domain-containing protein [Maricaulis sp.]|uniref:endonuclease domain-containing protein n=1 Tax=Maricaulis sp. TaxID=1486257 RepID=UPI003A8E0D16